MRRPNQDREDSQEPDRESSSDRATSQLAVWRAARARKQHERAEIKRFTRHRRARRRGVIIGASAFVLLLALLAAAIYSPLMNVTDVRVEGTQRLNADEVTSALEPIKDRPIAQVKDGDVEAILREFVLVQSYTVQRIPPNTVIVHIIERQPIGVIEQNGSVTVVDGAGVSLWEDPRAKGSLPVITTSPSKRAEFAELGHVLTALPADVLQTIATVQAETVDSIRFTLRDGRKVVWGSSSDTQTKLTVLQALMNATDGSASEFDVSSPEQPVTRAG